MCEEVAIDRHDRRNDDVRGLRVLAAGWAGWAVQAACAPRRLADRPRRRRKRRDRLAVDRAERLVRRLEAATCQGARRRRAHVEVTEKRTMPPASDNGSSVNRIGPVFPGVSARSRDYGDVAAPVTDSNRPPAAARDLPPAAAVERLAHISPPGARQPGMVRSRTARTASFAPRRSCHLLRSCSNVHVQTGPANPSLLRTGSRKAPAARRADGRPTARRPLGCQRTLPARSVAGSDRHRPPGRGHRRPAATEVRYSRLPLTRPAPLIHGPGAPESVPGPSRLRPPGWRPAGRGSGSGRPSVPQVDPRGRLRLDQLPVVVDEGGILPHLWWDLSCHTAVKCSGPWPMTCRRCARLCTAGPTRSSLPAAARTGWST